MGVGSDRREELPRGMNDGCVHSLDGGEGFTGVYLA